MNWLFAFVFLLICVQSLQAQKTDSLTVVSFNTKEKVALKWLPASFEIWMEGVKTGYTIERYEVQLVAGKWKMVQKVLLTKQAIMPWDQEKLKDEIAKNPDFKNANLLLMGNDLDRVPLSGKQNKSIAELQSSKNFTFAMGLFSMAINNKIALAMGTYFEDSTALAGKSYLYRVKMNRVRGPMANILVNRNLLTDLPKILGFNFQTVHKGVNLFWLHDKKDGYVYYNIYRSESKNGNFKKLNLYPYIGEIGLTLDKKRHQYTDSFPSLDKTFYYKIIGVNAFEKESPATAALAVEATYFLQTAPRITKGESKNNKDVVLTWTVDEEEKPFIKGFSVWHASIGTGKYKKLNAKLADPNSYTYKDERKNKGTSNYYMVCAHGKHGDSTCSVLQSVFLIDSVPPVPPVVVSGVCDTNGVVTLKWKKGAEDDIYGYRIFRTYYIQKEPERRTPGDVKDSVFKDKVEIKSGYKKVYYGVCALDQHFNPSPLSKYFAVMLPDNNPPVNAAFTEYSGAYSGILLKWQSSPSADIKTQHLLRKSEFDFDWQPLVHFSGDSVKITQFRDTATKSGMWYEYALFAEDSSGLKSKKSGSLRIQQPEKTPFTVVKNIKAIVSHENKMVKLSWQFEQNATGFKIMRAKKGAPVETYKYLPGSKREFYDTWITPNTEYVYAVEAETSGGMRSLMSAKVEVKY